MGNKLCKKKSEESAQHKTTPFDRIITRLHLRPNSWTSDPNLDQKPIKRHGSPTKTQLLSKSSDWSDSSLNREETPHLRNPKLALIFDNNTSTPVPPPRKQKNIREKIEAVAKSGLQALQIQKKPVDEPLFVKKIVSHTSPLDGHDCALHRRNHKQEDEKQKREDQRTEGKKEEVKGLQKKKNLSVVSLPNFSELKLTEKNDSQKSIDNSLNSLPVEGKSKTDTYMTRCRSFGSLLPQQLLHKLKTKKVPIDIESDDSFGALEDWDLRVLEHYHPSDTSLPRQSKPRTKTQVQSDIENLIVKEEDSERPKPQVRKSESLLKRITQKASEAERNNVTKAQSAPSPDKQKEEKRVLISDGADESGEIEHSNLMKILQEFSIKEKNEKKELQRKIESVEDFLKNEKMYIDC